MRQSLSLGVVLILIVPIVLGQVRPPQSQIQQIQQDVEARAMRLAEDLEGQLRGTTVGTLSPEGNLAIAKWDQAVRLWKRERGAGAAPLLAEGVLFDCLSRLQGVRTVRVGDEVKQPILNFADLAEDRPERAAKAFDAALKIDPQLGEASMRAARIRALKNSRAVLALERLAEDQAAGPIAYLSAMSRAEVARTKHDMSTAVRWYERALAAYPRSTAATIALGAIRPSAALSFSAMDPQDLYYVYPCAILTSDVGAALAGRVSNVALK